jgi:hypothetical protein
MFVIEVNLNLTILANELRFVVTIKSLHKLLVSNNYFN